MNKGGLHCLEVVLFEGLGSGTTENAIGKIHQKSCIGVKIASFGSSHLKINDVRLTE